MRLIAIVAASLAVKLALVWPAAQLTPLGDEARYLIGAQRIVETGRPSYDHLLWDETHAAPLYPYALAGVLALSGEDAFRSVFRALQALLSTLTLLPLWLLARRGFGDRVAALTLAAAAFYPTLIAYTQFFWSETFFLFFLLSSLALLAAQRDTLDPRLCAAAGVMAGCGALTRSVLLPQLVVAVLWLLAARGAGWPRRAAAVAALLGGAALVIAPWSIATSLRLDRFVLIDTNAGNVLYENWNALPPENYDIGRITWRPRDVRSYRGSVPIRPRVSEANPVDRNDAEVRAAFAFVAAHPETFARNSAIRAAAMVNPTSFAVRHLRHAERTRGLPGPLADALVLIVVGAAMAALALGAVGLSAPPRNRASGLLLGFLAVNAATCVLVIATSRYRLPLVVLALPFAAHAVDRWRSILALPRAWKRWLFLVPAFVGLVGVWSQLVHYNFPAR